MPIPRARRASSTSGRPPRSTQALGAEDAAFFAQHYDVTAGGNFEGHNILNRLSARYRAPPRTKAGSLRCATSFLRVRGKRIRPGLDDKVLADWNGLMIAALANAGAMLGRAGLDRDGRARLRFHRAQP